MKLKDYAILVIAGLINFAYFRWASIGPYVTGLMLGYIVLARPDWERVCNLALKAQSVADEAIAELLRREADGKQ